VFDKWSLDIVTSLFCASLPFAYAASKGVQVLERTSQLAQRGTVARRIAETGQLLIDIAEPGGLAHAERGYRTVRTVRLLHAAIRAKLLSTPSRADESGRWDVDELGVPINQEDLLGTLLSFTTVVFTSLSRLGIELSREQRIAYLQLWGLVGHNLGIDQANVILDPGDADQLTATLATDLHGRSVAGAHLMRILMGEMESSMPWGLRKLPRALVRHLAGNSVADLLEVPRGPWWGPVLPALERSNSVVGSLPGGRSLLEIPSRLLGRSMIRMWIDRTILYQQPTHMRIEPTTLAKWKIGTSPDRGSIGLRGRLRSIRRTVRQRQLGLSDTTYEPAALSPTAT
jgi:hypothetical protein